MASFGLKLDFVHGLLAHGKLAVGDPGRTEYGEYLY